MRAAQIDGSADMKVILTLPRGSGEWKHRQQALYDVLSGVPSVLGPELQSTQIGKAIINVFCGALMRDIL